MNIVATEMITLGDISWDMILGGFALFLFGIKFMGDGLKNVAGHKLREYIDKYTSNPIMAVLVGIVVTIVVQSSSAATAITIGLVRAGLMKLEQAAGVVVGANIGTTMTAFLIGLKVEQFAMYFVFIGGMIISFAKKKKTRYIGDIILGFGLMFYGLKIMGDSLKMLKDLPAFIEFAKVMSEKPLLGLLAGTVLTGLIQGSAATIGVVQKLYESGAMTLNAAMPFVFGACIGTTVTGVFAAIGGSLAAKRTAGLHTLFNVIAATIGMIFLPFYIQFITWISDLLLIPPMMQIAVVHILFKIVGVIVYLPLLNVMCNFIKKLIPGNEPERIEINLDDMDAGIAHQMPTAALAIAKQAVLKMSTVVDAAVDKARDFMNTRGGSDEKELVNQTEDLINSIDTKITNYLMSVSKENLNDRDMQDFNLHLQVIKNLERIGDLSVNLVEFFDMVHEDKNDFSDGAKKDVLEMFELFKHMLNTSIAIYRDEDYAQYSALMEDENYMDLLEYKARQKHFDRMARNECATAVGGSVYCDILGNLERMADHCCNIARCSIEASSSKEAPVLEHH